jgi:hypothetical protein
MGQGDVVPWTGADFLMTLGKGKQANHVSVVVEGNRPRPDHIHFRVEFQKFNLPSQPFGKRDVIGIHAGDILPFSQVNSLIETSGKTLSIGPKNWDYPLISK